VVRWQLAAVGVTPAMVKARVARGSLTRLHRGVYVVGQPKLSREGEWLAAVLATEGALSHHSCGLAHGISRFREPRATVTTTCRARPEGVRVHTVRRLDRRELTSHLGIPVTTVHRLLVDLADELTPHQLANVIHQAAFRGRFVEPAVRDAMARANGRHHLHVLDRAIALHRMGSAGTRSGAEDAFLAQVAVEPLVNMELLGFEVDFRWPDRRLIVEVDGGHHALRADADDARDGVLADAGWTVLRYSDRDAYERSPRIAAALEPYGLMRAA
jgi:hypothetical protein